MKEIQINPIHTNMGLMKKYIYDYVLLRISANDPNLNGSAS
jgi:hypothetical protein